MTAGAIQTTAIVVGMVLLAVGINQMSPTWGNGVRLFNGFMITWMLVWVIREILPYRRLLIVHREDLLDVFRYDEQKRAEEFAELRRTTEEIAAKLAEENKHRHTEITEQLAGLKKPEGSS